MPADTPASVETARAPFRATPGPFSARLRKCQSPARSLPDIGRPKYGCPCSCRNRSRACVGATDRVRSSARPASARDPWRITPCARQGRKCPGPARHHSFARGRRTQDPRLKAYASPFFQAQDADQKTGTPDLESQRRERHARDHPAHHDRHFNCVHGNHLTERAATLTSSLMRRAKA